MKKHLSLKRSVPWSAPWSYLVTILLFCGVGGLVYYFGNENEDPIHAHHDREIPSVGERQAKRAMMSKRDHHEASRNRQQSNHPQAREIDFSQMETALAAMTHDQLTDEKTQKLIISWASAHPQDAKKWALEIGNAQLRQPLAQHVALGIVKTDPQAAAMFVVNDFLPGNQQDESLVAVVSEWAKRDPNLVAQWLLEFPHDTMGGNAVTALISTWADQDPSAAGEWLSSLPPSSLRNTGLVAYINAVRHIDEKRAEQFVKLIDLHL